jgi:hypothetical protein
MKRTEEPSHEDDARMRRVMGRLRALLEELAPASALGMASPRPTDRRTGSTISGEIIV